MNYDIKLYVHGVPYGQKTWGVPNFDETYIDSFYGRKSDAPVQMLVENRQIDSHKYSYYTYYRVENIYDASNRSGSYFALTLRLNYYYADVQNIYNVLDAAFNKFIVGTVLKSLEKGYVYNAQDLAQFESTFLALEQELQKYLMQFSTDNDFLPLNGFVVNSQAESAAVNLLEYNSNTIANHVKKQGNISVSPLFPTNKEQKFVQEMNKKIAAVQQKANEQVASVQKSAKDAEKIANEKVALAEKAANEKVAKVERKAEADIKAIKDQYKDVDKTISKHKETVQKKEEETVNLSKQIAKLEAENKDLKQAQQDYEARVYEFEENQKLVENVRKSLSGFSELSKLLGEPGCPTPSPSSVKKGVPFMKIVKEFHPFVDFLVVIALLIICAISLPKSCSSNKQVEQKMVSAQATIDSLSQELNKTQQLLVEAEQQQKSASDYTSDYEDATIDIKDYSSSNLMKMNQEYKVKLIGVDASIGEWYSEDFKIEGDMVTPKHSGSCVLSFRVDGVDVVTRKEIKVVE